VSTTDETIQESLLRAELERELAAVHPGAPPLDAVLRRSHAVRVRRRAFALGWTAAALAAVAAAVPGITYLARPQPPAAPIRHQITDYPPSPGAPSGQIASGTVDGVKWSVRAGEGSGSQGFCFWPAESPTTQDGPMCGEPKAAFYPIDDDGGSGPPVGPFFQYLEVQPQIARVVVRFADGQTLSLHPVTIDGHHVTAFALPPALPVEELIGYAADGKELGFTAPLDPMPGQTGVSGFYDGWYTPKPTAAGDPAPDHSSP
jgi:hypothetical protein